MDFYSKTVLEELQHTISYDSKGQLLKVGKNTNYILPPDIPASDFWSIILYDPPEPLNNSHRSTMAFCFQQ